MAMAMAMGMVALVACSASPELSSKTRDGIEDAGEDDAGAPSRSIHVVSLGPLVPGVPLEFDVPAGTLGFTLSVVSDATELGIRSLTTPSGRAAVTDFTPEGGTRPIGRGTRGAATVGMPASTRSVSDAAPLSGRWTATIEGPAGAPVTLRLQTTADGAFHGGVLDLDVYVPDGLIVHDPDPPHAVVPGRASEDPCLSRRVQLFFGFLEKLVGIRGGDVRFHRIDASYRSATSGNARAALLSAAREDRRGLAIVLTNEMSYGNGGAKGGDAKGGTAGDGADSLLGYSVGLPGMVDAAGQPHGAIGVALGPDVPAKDDALTILHELGHFAGLMHTTDDDAVDLFEDTPSCTNVGKQCPDATNLMAFSGPLGGIVLSPSQVRVMRGSPFFRATRSGSGATPQSSPKDAKR